MTLYLILVGWSTVFIETALPTESPSPEAVQKISLGHLPITRMKQLEGQGVISVTSSSIFFLTDLILTFMLVK